MFDEESFQSLVFTSPISCNKTPTVASSGVWVGDDPLNFLFPILLLQLILLFAVARLTHFVLRHLGLPSAISYIIGGILLGPSIFGRLVARNPDLPHTDAYWKTFATENTRVLLILSRTADMFFTLVIGVKTDISMLRRSGKKAVGIALSNTLLPSTLMVYATNRIGQSYDLSIRLYGNTMGMAFSQTSYVVLCAMLNEYQMLTSKLGRLALSTAILANLGSFWVTVIGNAFNTYIQTLSWPKAFVVPAITVLLIALLQYGVRPVARWMVKQTAPGQWLSKDAIATLMMITMAFVILIESLGYGYSLAALSLGIFLPGGPPLGSALVQRLDVFVTGVLMPVHLARMGMQVDVFSVYRVSQCTTAVLFVLGITLAKFVGVLGPCMYCKLPYRDAFLLGLMLNCRGIMEANASLNSLEKRIIEDQLYTVFVLMAVVLGSISGALLKVMYKPSLRFVSYRRRTIQHSKPGDSLRVLAAVHLPAHVPAISALLDASNPTADSALHVYVLHLVPLVGHAAAVLAPLWREGLPKPPTSDLIAANFAAIERRHPRLVVTLPYVSMAPPLTMHDDVCALALDKKAALIILPFHGPNAAYQTTCVRVLSYAPCSVGVLVDRGCAADPRGFLDIGVFFLGGADDREALAYAARVAEGPASTVTVVRFRVPAERREGGREEVLDDAAVRDFRGRTVENERVVYREEVVGDGPSMVEVIRMVCARVGLAVVGRRKGRSSELTAGLEEWSEYPELGVLGDMLASPDFEGKASALVIQQQARIAGHVSR